MGNDDYNIMTSQMLKWQFNELSMIMHHPQGGILHVEYEELFDDEIFEIE